jgi:hypothetical protein
VRSTSQEWIVVEGAQVLLVALGDLVIRDRNGEEDNVFVDLVQRALEDGLFLHEPVKEQDIDGVEAADVAGQFLNQRLWDPLLAVPEDDTVVVAHELGRLQARLEAPEGVRHRFEALVVAVAHAHRGA